ncbi:MAG: tRNA (adenosine(37)-N6)-threonylcarbamoyltransferase complex transferase subunit TsaD [Desulfobulbaceae bacterium]|jgi:N6-L-threonylcarbamoyladenine synthase|nr:tRNA (adenosine(37)-N6)-threonylcarbamoyltransferase complex transferase subunit TsaD [Desulfobulbaceae bacterium]
MIILGIESSCDETACAVMQDDTTLLSHVVDSQITIHRQYGGVVPEIASRRHIESIYPVVDAALKESSLSLADVDLLAVTAGPGLIGALLIGLNFTKAISLVKDIPFVGVDHMAGHLLSVFLGENKPEFPFVAIVASGGHSSLFYAKSYTEFELLGRTRDDAAGEAFDKVAKILGLPYPGGPEISLQAQNGDRDKIKFPRSWLEKGSFDFSFSGLKTSVANYVHKTEERTPEFLADVCASFQEAVVDVLSAKAVQAAQFKKCQQVVLAGGVAANPRLRDLLGKRCRSAGLNIAMPPLDYCTDNGAMICIAGYHQYRQNGPSSLDLDVYSRSPLIMQG